MPCGGRNKQCVVVCWTDLRGAEECQLAEDRGASTRPRWSEDMYCVAACRAGDGRVDDEERARRGDDVCGGRGS
jgi:hypothetical protein